MLLSFFVIFFHSGGSSCVGYGGNGASLWLTSSGGSCIGGSCGCGVECILFAFSKMTRYCFSPPSRRASHWVFRGPAFQAVLCLPFFLPEREIECVSSEQVATFNFSSLYPRTTTIHCNTMSFSLNNVL